QLNFYDFSTRPPADLATINPITWSAALYPVIVGANGTSLEVENGTSWGWSMKKATVGTDSAVFVDPIPDPDAVLTGVNTNSFAWGSGNPSSLTFDGRAFDTLPNTTFDLGTLTFHNGTISSGTGANGVWFDLAIAFDNVPEKNFHLKTQFGIVNTLNTDDPIASADFVTIGDFGYTFNVLEGGTASVDIFAKLTTGLSGVPAGTAGDSLISSDPFDPSPNYTLTIVGLGNPTAGGFVT
ncbi:MAG: choice-of-anchor K domain-containing protein, partial [Candidatus Solibacter sp.]|nr:choice-of-anchor K domain-containing protein [Candidatus Solibacter sp.]